MSAGRLDADGRGRRNRIIIITKYKTSPKSYAGETMVAMLFKRRARRHSTATWRPPSGSVGAVTGWYTTSKTSLVHGRAFTTFLTATNIILCLHGPDKNSRTGCWRWGAARGRGKSSAVFCFVPEHTHEHGGRCGASAHINAAAAATKINACPCVRATPTRTRTVDAVFLFIYYCRCRYTLLLLLLLCRVSVYARAWTVCMHNEVVRHISAPRL